MMEQPKNVPNCCSKPAKWVEQTPSLAYFYCETCKTEPKVIDDSLVNLSLKTGFSDIGGSWQRILVPYSLRPQRAADGITSPPPITLPSTLDELDNYNVGSRVRGRFSGAIGRVHAICRASRTITVIYDDQTWHINVPQAVDNFILLS